MGISKLKKQQPSLIGVDVKRLYGREDDSLEINSNSRINNNIRFKKIKALKARCLKHSQSALHRTSHHLGLKGINSNPDQPFYPSKPEIKKRHWFAAGVIVCLSSWISFSSTASIKRTSLESIGLEEPLAVPRSLNLLSDSEQARTTAVHINEPAPETIEAEPIALEEEIIESNIEIHSHIVKPGDTLGKIFEKLSLPRILPSQIVATEEGKRLKNIAVGRTLEFELENGEFRQLSYKLSPLKQLRVAKAEGGELDARETIIDFDTRVQHAEATIEHSLFLAGSKAGINENLIMELAGIFGWDIDFVRDIRKGDSFKLTFEQHHQGDEVLSNGRILAAEFINKGEKFNAIYFEDSKGGASYYSEDGNSMRGTFLKSPMKFSRISSGFSRKRFHPVLKKWRAHKGVDYAAGRGTPIRSTANGKVIYKGTKGGYGRTVVISHGGKYSTLYAHMSRYGKGVRSGGYVKQGQTIGYVGATGLATGPHLHYEFRVNGVHRNPLTFKTPKATPVLKSDRAKFKLVAKQQLEQLNGINPQLDTDSEIQIATAEEIVESIKTKELATPNTSDATN